MPSRPTRSGASAASAFSTSGRELHPPLGGRSGHGPRRLGPIESIMIRSDSRVCLPEHWHWYCVTAQDRAGRAAQRSRASALSSTDMDWTGNGKPGIGRGRGHHQQSRHGPHPHLSRPRPSPAAREDLQLGEDMSFRRKRSERPPAIRSAGPSDFRTRPPFSRGGHWQSPSRQVSAPLFGPGQAIPTGPRSRGKSSRPEGPTGFPLVSAPLSTDQQRPSADRSIDAQASQSASSGPSGAGAPVGLRRGASWTEPGESHSRKSRKRRRLSRSSASIGDRPPQDPAPVPTSDPGRRRSTGPSQAGRSALKAPTHPADPPCQQVKVEDDDVVVIEESDPDFDPDTGEELRTFELPAECIPPRAGHEAQRAHFKRTTILALLQKGLIVLETQ